MLDRKIWDELAKEVSSGKGIVRRRIASKNGVNLYMAIDSDSRLPAIIVESSSAIFDNITSYTSTGFSLLSDRITINNKPGIRLLLKLSESRFIDVFYILADNTTSRMLSAVDEDAALKEFLNRMSLWKSFFNKFKEKGMTREEQQGMWGELWTMKNLLFEYPGISTAVTSWMGPEGSPQDFYVGQNVIEVKTSTIPPHEKFQVSGIRQLDHRGSGKLLLVFIGTETKPGRENSLPSLIMQIRGEIAESEPTSLDAFNTKLLLGGYVDDQVKLYENLSYYVRKSMLYIVTDAFPRLLESNLPDGIGDVRYSVSVAACNDCAVSTTDFYSIIRELES